MTKKKKTILIIGILLLLLVGIFLICLLGFKHKHQLFLIDAVAETCLEDGFSEHYFCEGCDKRFMDETGEFEVSGEELVVAAPGHELEEYDAVNPSFTKEGIKQHWKCTRCGLYFLDAACTIQAKKIDLILAVLDGDGIDENTTVSGEFTTTLLKSGTLKVQEGMDGVAKIAVAGNANLTKVYRDGAEVSFAVTLTDDDLYSISKVTYNGQELTETDGVYTLNYNADSPTIYIEIERNHSESGVTLPDIPVK